MKLQLWDISEGFLKNVSVGIGAKSQSGGRNTEMSKVPYRRLSWKLWLGWILANTIGLVAGVLLDSLAMRRVVFPWFNIHDNPISRVTSCVAVGALVGSTVGLAQWLVLRPRIQKAGRLVLANMVGSALGNGLVFAFFTLLPDHWIMIGTGIVGPYHFVRLEFLYLAGGVIYGAAVGIAQYRVLKDRLSPSYLWILSSALGWGLGILVGDLGSWVLRNFSQIAYNYTGILTVFDFLGIRAFYPYPIIGAVVGTITGLVLISLARKNPL